MIEPPIGCIDTMESIVPFGCVKSKIWWALQIAARQQRKIAGRAGSNVRYDAYSVSLESRFVFDAQPDSTTEPRE